MARVQVIEPALPDLDRLFDFIAAHDPKRALDRISSVRRAFELLILSRGRYGYIAKYRWIPAEDLVLILAVRHQPEAGYKEE